MKRILVCKNVLYAGKIGGGTISGINEINLLASGAVAIFTDTNVLLTASTPQTALQNVKKIYFAVGRGSATLGAKLSSLIDRASIDVRYAPYTAPVAEVQLIGGDGSVGNLNLPTLAAGQSAIIKIVNTGYGTQPPIQKKTYEYVVKTGDVAQDIVDGLVALINGDADAGCTAAAVSTDDGISITTTATDSEGNYTHLEVLPSGILIDADMNYAANSVTVALVYGSGVDAQVAKIEATCSAVEGNTNQLFQANLWWTMPTDVVQGATYNLWNLTWDDVKDYATRHTVATREMLIFAAPTSASTIPTSTIATILDAAFGTYRWNAEMGS